jgi:hypothetical protein
MDEMERKQRDRMKFDETHYRAQEHSYKHTHIHTIAKVRRLSISAEVIRKIKAKECIYELNFSHLPCSLSELFSTFYTLYVLSLYFWSCLSCDLTSKILASYI